MKDVVIASACRTAIGAFGGTLRDLHVTKIASVAMKAAIERSGIDPARIDDVRFGCCLEPVDSMNMTRIAALMAGIPESVTAATINRVCISGMEATVSGMAMIQAGMADVVLAGGAEERRAARRQAAEAAGVGHRLLDLGVVAEEDVVPLLAGASALAMPSFLEGFGLPVLEAQAVGTPVVCADRGGLPEAAGDAALFASPEDPAALADALRRVLTDPVLAARLSARGRERARAFTWEASFEKVAAAWRDAAEGA